MENRKRSKTPSRSPSLPTVQYLAAEDVMACLEVGRSKAYSINRELNAELERDGYITIAGKIPARKLCERLYLSSSAQTTAPTAKGRTTRSKK